MHLIVNCLRHKDSIKIKVGQAVLELLIQKQTSGIVMVLTSPLAYNFNCAPQSSQYLYTVHLLFLFQK